MTRCTRCYLDDDARVARLVVEKRWPGEDEAPGVDVRVWPLEATR